MKRFIELKPRINKANCQINFQLNKRSLPKDLKNKLPKLKGIRVDFDDFEFNDF